MKNKTIEVLGIVSEYQNILPPKKGIIFVFGNCTTDLSKKEVALGSLINISIQDNLFQHGNTYKSQNKEFAFCYYLYPESIEEEDEKILKQIVAALNLVHKPQNTLLNPNDYQTVYNKSTLGLKIVFIQCTSCWNYRFNLVFIQDYMTLYNTHITIPQLAHLGP